MVMVLFHARKYSQVSNDNTFKKKFKESDSSMYILEYPKKISPHNATRSIEILVYW
jgi:hypothetical protein